MDKKEQLQLNKKLIEAAGSGNLELVQSLFSQGVNIHAYNDYALISSVNNGHLDVVKYLVDAGADIHANHNQALRDASEKGHLKVVKYLVEHGADIHTLNNDEIFRKAYLKKDTELIKYLNSKGINIQYQNDVSQGANLKPKI